MTQPRTTTMYAVLPLAWDYNDEYWTSHGYDVPSGVFGSEADANARRLALEVHEVAGNDRLLCYDDDAGARTSYLMKRGYAEQAIVDRFAGRPAFVWSDHEVCLPSDLTVAEYVWLAERFRIPVFYTVQPVLVDATALIPY